MKGIRNTGSARVLNTVASMLLFLLFAVCMLMIIGSAAGIYSRIQKSHEATYGTSAAIRYITNKVRAADSCMLLENGSGMIFVSGNVASVVYKDGDGVFEKTAAADSDLSPEDGSLIFEVSTFSISEEDGLYRISVSCGANSSEALVRKG